MKKNLLQRIKPEALQAIQEKYKDYQIVYDDVLRQLESINYVSDMRYDLALTLEYLLPKIFTETGHHNVWSCFYTDEDMVKLDNELYEHSAE